MPTEYRKHTLVDRTAGSRLIAIATIEGSLGVEQVRFHKSDRTFELFDVAVEEVISGAALRRLILRVADQPNGDGRLIIPVTVGRRMLLFLAAEPSDPEGNTFSPLFGSAFEVEGDSVVGLPNDLARELRVRGSRAPLKTIRRVVRQIVEESHGRQRERDELLGTDALARPYPDVTEVASEDDILARYTRPTRLQPSPAEPRRIEPPS